MADKFSIDGYNLILGTPDADILNGTADARPGISARPIGDIIIGLGGDDTIEHSGGGSDIFVFRFDIRGVGDPGPAGDDGDAGQTAPTAFVSSGDGHDRILDFHVNADHLALEGIRDADFFREHFDVVKGVDSNGGRTLTIETSDNPNWSVELKLIGLDHAVAWNALASGSDALEQWAWDTLVAHAYDGPFA
jgi:hypothetical protein